MINQQLTEKAKGLISNGNLVAAESILKNLEDKYSIFELAKIRKIQGRNREAERLYLKSLSIPSKLKSHIDSDINIELGKIYASFGQIEEAEKRYKKGLDRISLENNIYRELGELYSRILKDKEAKDYLEKAVKLFPEDYKAATDLALVHMRMGRTDLSKEIFNKLLTKKEIKNNKFLYNQILNRYEILMKKEYLESNPREMRVTITNKCNIGCRYCDIWKVPDWQLSDERMKEIVNYFPYLENN